MKLEEMIKVMQHYADGGEVECAENGYNDWKIVNNPVWAWHLVEYRIKEPKQKVTIEKWLVENDSGHFYIIEASDVSKLVYYKKVKLLETYEVEL